MFVTEKLVFLELHKTGGSHIRRLLGEVLGGEKEGKHNRLNPAYKDRFIVGSVRNPWDWYVSLWAYGCGGKGSVYLQAIDGLSPRYYRESLREEMGVEGWGLPWLLRQALHDLRKDRAFWRGCYKDAEDPEGFRRWLSRLLDPEYALDIREGFGFSPLSQHAGLMSYRYIKLFSEMGMELYLDRAMSRLSMAAKLLDESLLVDYVIRNECLEQDFLDCMAQAGITLNEQQQALVMAGAEQKTNASKRREAAYYYDADSIELIAQREALIIHRHGYQPPKG